MKFKKVKTDKYLILFDKQTGTEILQGINKHPDPFSLEFPSLLDIGIMGHCSNKCEFCYQGDLYQKHMTLYNFKKIIDECKDHTMQIALGGRGSPNEHPQFKEIIEYSVNNNVIPNYTTSGIKLMDRDIEISKKCGAVAVSMYNEGYTFTSLKRLMDADIKTNIHYVLSNKSFKDIMKLLNGKDIWNGKVDLNKLNAVIFLLFKPQGRGKKLKDWILTKDQIKEFSNVIKEMSIKKSKLTKLKNFILRKEDLKFGVGLDSCCICKISQSRELTKLEKISADTCEAARMSCYISPNMKLVPCSFGNPNIYGIPISNRSIKKIWTNGTSFKIFRDILRRCPEKCPFGL